MNKRRTRYDRNEIVIQSDYAEIILYDIHQVEQARTCIDIADISSIAGYRWSLTEYGYVRGKLRHGKPIFIHRVIASPPVDKFVDHIDWDRLNNRRSNLRVVGKAENSMNRNTPANSTTGHRGVSYDACRNKYRAVIKINGKQLWLGYHTEILEAVAARQKAEMELFCDYSPTSRC